MTSLIYRQPGIIKQINQSKQLQQTKDNITQSVNLSYKNFLIFPQSIPNINFSFLTQLIIDYNKLAQFQFDTQIFPLLTSLSIQNNQLTKFHIRRSVTSANLIPNVEILNLTNNRLQFIDLSCLIRIKSLYLSHNNLSTIILNESNLEVLDISYNMLSNIQYSVLGGRLFSKLQQINVSNNKRSLYDLILAVNGIQLLPNLQQLNCSNNVLSYLQNLPPKLQKLNLQNNNFIFDRRAINQIIKLKNLKELKIGGNTINQDYLNIMESKIMNKNIKIFYQQQRNQNYLKQSPYRIYEDGNRNNRNQQDGIIYSNFTLGNQNQNIDPDYDLVQQTPRLFTKKQLQTEQKQQQQENDKTALKNAQVNLKSQKYKLKIQGLRYHNHYRLYIQKLSEFMLIPPRPLLHSQRNKNISVRIDPSEDEQLMNQFQLLNQMFKARGGVHYVRKVYNWEATQKMQHQDLQIAFINIEMSQNSFNKICENNYSQFEKAIKSKYLISQQPSSFSCYHILARLSTKEPKWSCFYLIEAVHL